MKVKKNLFFLAFALASSAAFSVTPDIKQYEKDNTALNRTETTTAESQMKGSEADIELTRKLRERLMADNQLSTSAHNIKIITLKEAITLSGPVANKAERVKIENLARSMAGKKKVYNRLFY